jgi:hypothetical protein
MWEGAHWRGVTLRIGPPATSTDETHRAITNAAKQGRAGLGRKQSKSCKACRQHGQVLAGEVRQHTLVDLQNQKA